MKTTKSTFLDSVTLQVLSSALPHDMHEGFEGSIRVQNDTGQFLAEMHPSNCFVKRLFNTSTN
jgi:hypothetical protein